MPTRRKELRRAPGSRKLVIHDMNQSQRVASEVKHYGVRSVPVHPKHSERIAIKNQGRIRFVHLNEVFAVIAQGNYVLLQRDAGSYCLRESISLLAGRLEPYGFVRIHRSALVNRYWVEEVSPYLTGEYLLHLRGGRELKVSRSYKKNLRSLAELWLGNDI